MPKHFVIRKRDLIEMLSPFNDSEYIAVRVQLKDDYEIAYITEVVKGDGKIIIKCSED